MGDMLWPNGTVTRPNISSGFGPRDVTQAGASSYHLGVDFTGFPTVHAIADGVVSSVGWRSGWSGGGFMIWLDHDGFSSRNLHLVDGLAFVQPGQRVSAGQPLGSMGNTARPSPVGKHLHLELVLGGRQIDPVPFITARLGGHPAGGGSIPTPRLLLKGTDMEFAVQAISDASVDGIEIRAGQTFAVSCNAPIAIMSADEVAALDWYEGKNGATPDKIIGYRLHKWDGPRIRGLIATRGCFYWSLDKGRTDYTDIRF